MKFFDRFKLYGFVCGLAFAVCFSVARISSAARNYDRVESAPTLYTGIMDQTHSGRGEVQGGGYVDILTTYGPGYYDGGSYIQADGGVITYAEYSFQPDGGVWNYVLTDGGPYALVPIYYDGGSASIRTCTDSATSGTSVEDCLTIFTVGTYNDGGTNTVQGIHFGTASAVVNNTFPAIQIDTGHDPLINAANFSVSAAGAVVATSITSASCLTTGSAYSGSGITSTGATTLKTAPNSALTAGTGTANNGAWGTMTGLTVTTGTEVCPRLGVAWQAGTNTMAFGTSTTSPVVSHFDHTSTIAHAYTTSSIPCLLYDGTNWEDESQ